MDRLVGFIPISQPERARSFYVDLLGLAYVGEDRFALMLQSGANMVRLVKMESVEPRPFTILGWETEHLVARVLELSQRGVHFLRYDGLEQDALSIWTAPGGAQVAWFADPDGNVLSLTQH